MFGKLALCFLSLCCLTGATAQSLTIYGEDLAPSIYLDANGKPSGYAVEAVQDIMRRLGDKTPIKVQPWMRIYREIQEKDDIVVFLMGRTAAREKLFKWVGPIIVNNAVLVGKKGSRTLYGTIESAKKAHHIGVVKDDVKKTLLENLGFTNLAESSTGDVNLKNMALGRTTMIIGTTLDWRRKFKELDIDPLDYEEVLLLDEIGYYIAFSKNVQDSLIAKWQGAYEASIKDGTLQRILGKWLEGVKAPALKK